MNQRLILLPRPRTFLRAAAVSLAALGLACAATPPPKTPTPPETTAAPTAPTTPPAAPAGESVECDLVCQGATLDDGPPRPLAANETADEHTQAATRQANATLAAMHGDLLACYKSRLSQAPKAHGFITIDIIVAETGRVKDVITTGGALLGEGAMACIVERVKKGVFAPVHNGGTRRIHVPFNFHRAGPDQST